MQLALARALHRRAPARAPGSFGSLARAHARRHVSAAQHLMVDAFRRHGHLEARIDPLGLAPPRESPELAAAVARAVKEDGDTARALEADLRRVYCSSLGVEMEHVEDPAERAWLAAELERPGGVPLASRAELLNAHTLMTMAEEYELFMQRKFVSFKRYSGEGAEAMLPGLHTMLHTLAHGGVTDVVLGMPHRGRLALMLTLLDLPADKLFTKVLGRTEFPDEWQLVDDVSSHLFLSVDKSYAGAPPLHVSMLPNPSHLEAINPVAQGKVRHKRERGRNAVNVLLHGDAAFSGQGVVPETCSLATLPGFRTGGTLHIVTNNQVGFTASHSEGRSSRYATCTAKGIGAPVLHVNGEDAGAVIHACRLAVRYQQRFGKDIFVDLLCYRKHGHNEVDEPSFTQPHMYDLIRSRQPYPERLRAALIDRGWLTQDKADALRARLVKHLEDQLARARDAQRGADPVAAFTHGWERMRLAEGGEMERSPDTGLPVEQLRDAARASVRLPDGFALHPRLKRGHVDARLDCLGQQDDGSDARVDWATAEAMAMATLIQEGSAVRICGQDAQRGTFSHRHAVLVDQRTEEKHSPLAQLAREVRQQEGGAHPHARFEAVSSNLSEFAVLGFEVGYSWEHPDALVLWEAQFGDFANGAQIVIDQFITGSESKWLRQTGLTLLLPSGQDGAGPEHSSGRVERFLQLSDHHIAPAHPHSADRVARAPTNLIVANLTTPANYFHFLRRQIHRPFRKPAVLLAPKTLLRLPAATSRLSEMAPGTGFRPVLDDPVFADDAHAREAARLILCSGKIYYDLLKLREAAKDTAEKATAIVRLEELSPFPSASLASVIARYSLPKSLTWAQEEPLNAGVWSFANMHMHTVRQALGKDLHLDYAGPPALPTPAWGVKELHDAQVEANARQWFPSAL